MMRKKLLELLEEYPPNNGERNFDALADHLIENGVTIVKKAKPRKQICILWNPGHHGIKQRCEQLEYMPCSCNGDPEKCDYRKGAE